DGEGRGRGQAEGPVPGQDPRGDAQIADEPIQGHPPRRTSGLMVRNARGRPLVPDSWARPKAQYRLNFSSALPIDFVSLMSGTIRVSLSSYWRRSLRTWGRNSTGTTTTPVLSATIQSPLRTRTPPQLTGTFRAT